VAECVGRQNQDLSELLDKRAKEKEQRQIRMGMRASLSAASPQAPSPGTRDHFQTRHRPLLQLIGTPTGHHGRAVVPTESPFEVRQRASEISEDRSDSRPSKRRKHDTTPPSKMGYAQNLFGASLTLSAVPISSAPPRRPTGQTYRAQPEVSSRQEETVPDIERTGERQGLGVSKVNPRPGLPRTLPESDGGALLPGRDPPELIPAALNRPRLEKLIPAPQTTTPTAVTAVSNRHLGSFGNDLASTAGGKPKIPSKKSERKSDVPNPQAVVTKTSQTKTNRDYHLNPQPKVGASRSKAIVLDDDTEGRREGLDRASKPIGRANSTAAVSKPLDPSVGRQNIARRNNSPPPPAQPLSAESNSVEAPPDEERTELRLKPRQKRGLLLVSEKKKRTKQPKRQDALARELNSTKEYPDILAKAATSEPNPRSGAATPDPWSTPRPDDPLPFLPFVPGYPLSGQPQGDQTRQEPCGIGLSSENAGSPPRYAADPGEHSTATIGQPSPQGLSPNTTDNARDEMVALSPSPKRRRIRRGEKTLAQAHEELNRITSPSPEDPLTDPAPDTSSVKPTKQTRKSNRLNGEDSARSRRKVQMAEEEDSDNEELPRVPIRPRLIRLSRKSVRSREVIGYVPSRPLVINPTSPEGPPSEVLETTSPPLAMGDTAIAVSDSANPTNTVDGALSVSDGTLSLAEKTRGPLPSTASMGDPAPALQHHKSLTEGVPIETATKDTHKDRGRNPTRQQLGDPSSRHGLAGGRSTVFPVGGGRDGTIGLEPARPQNIAVPEKDIAPATLRTCNADQRRRSATEAASPPSPLHESRNLPDQDQHPMNNTHDIAVASRVTDGPSKAPLDLPSAGASRPRITNPASRGRKAALRSDAAGQVPQSILPVEPVPVRVGMQPPAPVQRDPVPNSNERPKRKMTFPGFVSAKAGGGPWSREAHDLLESVRPC
jgi:hypothetical protein